MTVSGFTSIFNDMEERGRHRKSLELRRRQRYCVSRPHYVSWSEQQEIESHAPQYLRNVVRIIAETGLRIYKELIPMRKDQVDLQNAVVWIPDSKTPNGAAEVPLTSLAIEAFKNQMAISGEGPYLFPSDLNPLLQSGRSWWT